jgi:predicted amidophosphoribosyltransferase
MALAALRAWVVAVERSWLGWSFAPPDRVISSIGWRPDAPGAYCGRCGGSVGPGEATGAGCSACRGRGVPHDGIVRLGSYSGPMVEWVCAIKYQRWGEMAETLGALLGAAISARLDAAGGWNPARTLVVPMPMPWQRRIYRGIDHAGLLAAAAAERMRAVCRALLTVENGPPQVSMARAMRGRRQAAMRLRRRAAGLSLEGVDVVLVDDVRTSGATLGAAARLLRALEPRRLLAGVAAVAEPGRRVPRGPFSNFTAAVDRAGGLARIVPPVDDGREGDRLSRAGSLTSEQLGTSRGCESSFPAG